jgi:Ca2+-binding EF-hand superfamily protein
VIGAFAGQETNWVEFFNAIDVDKSNDVNFEEFQTAAQDRATMINQTNIEHVFKLFDKNGDGSIDIDEIKSVFQNKMELQNNKEKRA